MDEQRLNTLLDEKNLRNLFPPSRTVEFFEALFGDNEEGAYDIALRYLGCAAAEKRLDFALELHERPGRCLACNLTQGLPQVFERHPIINIQGLVEDIVRSIGEETAGSSWRLGRTHQQARNLHVIPLTITLG